MAKAFSFTAGAMPCANVQICLNGNSELQRNDFRLCPLGVQFYSSRRIPEFQLTEFRLTPPGAAKNGKALTCTGMVVCCKPVENRRLYRIWIKFLDLTPSQESQLRSLARRGKYLCPYCENF